MRKNQMEMSFTTIHTLFLPRPQIQYKCCKKYLLEVSYSETQYEQALGLIIIDGLSIFLPKVVKTSRSTCSLFDLWFIFTVADCVSKIQLNFS